jgi:hypothetical protein
MSEEKVVLTYTPSGEPGILPGVPARDLTEEDVANLTPEQLRDATLPGPTGQPRYTRVKGAMSEERLHEMAAEDVTPEPETKSKRG